MCVRLCACVCIYVPVHVVALLLCECCAWCARGVRVVVLNVVTGTMMLHVGMECA